MAVFNREGFRIGFETNYDGGYQVGFLFQEREILLDVQCEFRNMDELREIGDIPDTEKRAFAVALLARTGDDWANIPEIGFRNAFQNVLYQKLGNPEVIKIESQGRTIFKFRRYNMYL